MEGGYAVGTTTAENSTAASQPSDSGCLHVVVQRCLRAKLLVDAEADAWTEIGRGLVLYISFARGAPPAGDGCTRFLRQAAKSILSAPLSTSDKWQADHSDAESVVALCKRGEAQGLLVVPQASLVSKLELGDKCVKYYRQCAKDDASRLYHGFVDILRVVARELIAGPAPAKRLDGASWKALQEQRAKAATISPEEFFKVGEYEGKYSRFDERGLPTHLADGSEIPKAQLKKLAKIHATQSKKYAKASPSAHSEETPAKDEAEDPIEEAEVSQQPQEAEGRELETEVPLPEGSCLPEIRHGTFGGRQGFEMMSAGPFSHTFVF